MTIGILGGTFNPPHRGHLALAKTVLEKGLSDTVLLIPAAIPPHKANPLEADSETRLAMTRLLSREDARIQVDDLELRRSGPSFTIDTIRELICQYPEERFRLVIGSDMAKSFATWKEYRELLKLAPPLVAERPDSEFTGSPEEMFPGMSARERDVIQSGRFVMSPVDISSTMIRELLADGAEDTVMLDYLTPPVLAFIREKKLYC